MKTHLSEQETTKLEISEEEQDAHQRCSAAIKRIFGDELSPEKIAHYVQASDGNIHVAFNQILNDIEAVKRAIKSTPETSNNNPPLEKIISELAEELKCPICLSYFESPVVLGCLHTFCFSCAEEMAKDSDVIVCPLCRFNHDLNGRGAHSLKSNCYIANIVEKFKAAQVSKPCEKCQTNSSTLFCSQCNVCLCTDCDTKHHVQQKLSHKRIFTEEMLFSSSKPEPRATSLEQDSSFEGEEWAVPFNITKEVCAELFHSWTKGLWFAPTDLGNKSRLREFKAIFLPFWAFELDVTSRFNWLGVNQNPVTNVKSSSQKVNLLIGASKEYSDLIKEIEPWKIEQLKQMSAKITENVTVVPFTLTQETAEKSQTFRESLDQVCREKYIQKNKIDPSVWSTSFANSMNITNSIVKKKCKKLFVPVYLTTYEYKGKKYDFIVNGSTAKCYGQRPYSPGKLLSLGFTGVGALGLIAGARSFHVTPNP